MDIQERQLNFYKEEKEQYYQKVWENRLEKVSISMFTFVFGFLFTAIFGKAEAKFLETICFFTTVFSFLYFFYSIYRCIRLCCRGKV